MLEGCSSRRERWTVNSMSLPLNSAVVAVQQATGMICDGYKQQSSLSAHTPSVTEIAINPRSLSSPSFNIPSTPVRAMFQVQPDIVQPQNKC